MIIIPAILVHDEETFKKQVAAIQDQTSMIQLDIADGIFVPNTTWAEPYTVKEYVKIDMELHLMVDNPLEVLDQWKNVDQIKRVLFHYEADTHRIAEIIETIESYGWQASMVLNPETDIEVLRPYAEELFGAMCMGVTPGEQGKSFIPETTDRLASIKKQWPELFLEIDGSVNLQTLPNIVKTDLDALCIGSAIFNNTASPSDNISAIRQRIKALTGEIAQ